MTNSTHVEVASDQDMRGRLDFIGLNEKGCEDLRQLKPLIENKPAVHAEVAGEIRRWIEKRGLPAHRMLVVPGPAGDETWQAQAPTLLPGLVAALKLDDGAIRRLIGGNFANVVSTTFKPAPEK